MYFLLNDAVLNLQGDDLAPAALARRFGSIGFDYVQTLGQELFSEPSWLQVMLGQGLRPRRHHPLADRRPREQVAAFVDDVRRVVRRCVDVMPLHADFIAALPAAGAAPPSPTP